MAHNKQGVSVLFETLINQYNVLNPIILCGFFNQKNVSDILPIIDQHAGKFYYCEFSKRAHRWDTIKKSVPKSMQWQLGDQFPPGEVIVMTGSHYFISVLKKRYAGLLGS